jgi:hypothetical protein
MRPPNARDIGQILDGVKPFIGVIGKTGINPDIHDREGARTVGHITVASGQGPWSIISHGPSRLFKNEEDFKKWPPP